MAETKVILSTEAMTEPCGHAEPQALNQLHGVCVFCWRDRAGYLMRQFKESRNKRQQMELEKLRLSRENQELRAEIRLLLSQGQL